MPTDCYSSLPHIAAADARLIERALRNFQAGSELDSWQERLSELTGSPVFATLQPVESITHDELAASLGSDLVAAILCSRPMGKAKIAVECEMHLAACMLDRLLGADADVAVGHRLTPFNETEQGVLAYLVAHMLVTCRLDTWRLHSVASHPNAILALSEPKTWLVWPVHVRVGTVEGFMRILFPRDAVVYCTSLVTQPANQRLSPQAPMELVVQLATIALPANDIASLRSGDIVTLGRTMPSPETSIPCDTALQLLLPGNSGYTWTAIHRGNGELTVTSLAKGDLMPDATLTTRDIAAIDLEQLGDTPITLSIELGRFRLALQDVGQLLPGQCVQTGLTLGSEVTLKAGDKAVAFGELVNIDGELGVRIVRT